MLFSGVTGFDKEIDICVRGQRCSCVSNRYTNSSANKVARAVLSPIQLGDLQFAYAKA